MGSLRRFILFSKIVNTRTNACELTRHLIGQTPEKFYQNAGSLQNLVHFSSSSRYFKAPPPTASREAIKDDVSSSQIPFIPHKEHLSVPEELRKVSPHFKQRDKDKESATTDSIHGPIGAQQYLQPHPIWSEPEMDSIVVTHKEPGGKVDALAYFTVKMFRTGFDVFSGFLIGERTEKKWLNRIMFLETVAGVPGMVAAMVRHLHSLRRMKRDHGWIHTLLEEAENERMHLISAMMVKQPSVMFRGMVLLAQGIFTNTFFIFYLLSPRFCHRFVGYLEEEAVITYTKLLDDIDSGRLEKWRTMPAPDVAVNYWRLGEGATMRDMIRAIRADEAHHREVNHILSDLKETDENPFPRGS